MAAQSKINLLLHTRGLVRAQQRRTIDITHFRHLLPTMIAIVTILDLMADNAVGITAIIVLANL